MFDNRWNALLERGWVYNKYVILDNFFPSKLYESLPFCSSHNLSLEVVSFEIIRGQ